MYTYSFNLRVHRVPLHSECVGQLYRLFFCSCFCLWLPLVVDGSFPPAIQLCKFWSSNTGSQTVKQCTPCCKFLEWETWLSNEWDWSVFDWEVNVELESCVCAQCFRRVHFNDSWLTPIDWVHFVLEPYALAQLSILVGTHVITRARTAL